MTKEEKVRLLKYDLNDWNERRRPGRRYVGRAWQLGVDPDLRSPIDLSDVDLSGVELYEAVLDLVNLADANLTGTAFLRADVTHSVLRGATLIGAKLDRSDFSWSNLIGADLRGTHLNQTNFTQSILADADFHSAFLEGTHFTDVDLSRVKGLKSVVHRAPSFISIGTLYRSQGKIPESFLRDAGVPEGLITQIPSLIGAQDGIQFHSCFISHSSKDSEFAQRLHSRMQAAKLRVWYAPHDMRGGQKSHEQIKTQIQMQDKLLLVLSEASMQSEWVATEIYHARQRERREKRTILFPIRICSLDAIKEWVSFDSDSGKDMARDVRSFHIPDFSHWKDHDKFEAEFTKLLRDLKSETLP